MKLFIYGLELLGELLAYLGVLVFILLIIRFFFKNKIKDFVWRKMMHLVAFSSIIPLIYNTDNYLVSIIAIGYFIILFVIRLIFLEREEWFHDLLVEKYPYEIIISMTLFYLVMGLDIYIGWGLCFNRLIPLISICASGFGDALGALIGIGYGSKHWSIKGVDNKKTIVGSLALFFGIFFLTLILLFSLSSMPWWSILCVSLFMGLISMVIELYSPKGTDNLTLPLVNMGILVLYFYLITLL